jgi:hypothetical protein
MIVAMAAMRVMQMAIDEIIDVIAVRDRLVAAAGAVFVVLGVAAAVVSRRAGGRVLAADAQAVFLDPFGAHVVQVAVVQVVDVALMLDGGVATRRAVLVIVLGMKGSSHGETPFLDRFPVAESKG